MTEIAGSGPPGERKHFVIATGTEGFMQHVGQRRLRGLSTASRRSLEKTRKPIALAVGSPAKNPTLELAYIAHIVAVPRS